MADDTIMTGVSCIGQHYDQHVAHSKPLAKFVNLPSFSKLYRRLGNLCRRIV